LGSGHVGLLDPAGGSDYISRVNPENAARAGAARGLVRLAWIAVAVNILVILWGAVVRATGSGAGCGSHWPLCNGEIVPQNPRAATLIEFGHRLSSGLALLVVIWLAVRVLRAHRGPGARERALRRLAWLSVIFILGEAAIGAGIVLFEYVGENSSLARAVWMGLHLVNTFLLLGALALLADRLGRENAGTDTVLPRGWQPLLGFFALALTGASGAIAALGDTLFPAESLVHGVRQDFTTGAHFLLRLRALHPLIAFGAGLFWLHIAQEHRRIREPLVLQAANGVTLLVFVQFAVGLISLGLLAPVSLQLLHLLIADLLWMAGVLLVDRARENS
jgi:heme A synthase